MTTLQLPRFDVTITATVPGFEWLNDLPAGTRVVPCCEHPVTGRPTCDGTGDRNAGIRAEPARCPVCNHPGSPWHIGRPGWRSEPA